MALKRADWRTYVTGVGACILLLALVFGTLQTVSIRAYARLLKQTGITERVFVSGTPYDVVGDTVENTGHEVSGFYRWRALRLAYGVTLARRDAPFAVPGTDPDALASAATQLTTAMELLAAHQTSARDTAAIRTLYPAQFITAVAHTERARQTLLSNPTESTLAAYTRTLSNADRSYQNDLSAFTNSFQTIVNNTDQRIVLFSGVLTPESMRQALELLAEETEMNTDTLAHREWCLIGFTRLCPNVPEVTVASTTPITGAVSLTHEIGDLWRDAGATGTATQVALSKSACLPQQPAPYHMVFRDQRTEGGTLRILSYADNVFFNNVNVSKDFPYSVYARTKLDMHYTPLNPLKFYTCPQVGIDFGNASAIVRIAEFARTHPDIAPRERLSLLDEGLSENAVRSYLHAALLNDSTPSIRHELEELALMTARKTADFDQALRDLVHIVKTDTAPHMDGVVDVSARTQLLTHSAFPTFYRIGARDDSFIDVLYSHPADVIERFDRETLSYRDLRTHVPRAILVHDLRTFLNFENRNTSTIPTRSPDTNDSR